MNYPTHMLLFLVFMIRLRQRVGIARGGSLAGKDLFQRVIEHVVALLRLVLLRFADGFLFITQTLYRIELCGARRRHGAEQHADHRRNH